MPEFRGDHGIESALGGSFSLSRRNGANLHYFKCNDNYFKALSLKAAVGQNLCFSTVAVQSLL